MEFKQKMIHCSWRVCHLPTIGQYWIHAVSSVP